MKKRLVCVGDLHCGAVGGLTPPFAQVKKEQYPKIYEMQTETWKKYCKEVRKHVNDRKNGVIDKLIVVCNGDAIQGIKHEAWITDRLEQCDMAIKCLEQFNADQYIFTKGTPTHTGDEEDWENIIAKHFDGDIKPEQYVKVKGSGKNCTTFYFRHKIGRSTLPHGKFTAIARKTVENITKGYKGLAPKPDVCVFSHVHYYARVEDEDYIAYACPALQTVSEFGARQCEGIVHWGFLWWNIDNGSLISEGRIKEKIESIIPVEVNA